MGHPVMQHEVREIGKAEQARLLAAQFQNARQQRPIVPLRLCGASRVSTVHLFANAAVVQIRQYRNVTGRLQSETPPGKILRLCALQAPSYIPVLTYLDD